MTPRRSRAIPRPAFTLIELLAVLAIISLLTALTVPAVNRVRAVGKRTQCKVEIDQFGLSLSAFGADHGGNMPVLTGGGPNGEFRLCTSYTDSAGNLLPWPEVDFLLATWPTMNRTDNGLRMNGSPVPQNAPLMLDPNQAAMVWLTGGIPCQFAGLSKSPRQPFAPPVVGDERRRYLDPPSRALRDATGAGVIDGRFYDVYGNAIAVMTWSGQKGYVGACYGVQPYSTAFKGQLNRNGSQVISAGPDGKFGTGGNYTPGTGNWGNGTAGADDLANFRTMALGAPDGD